MIKDFEQQFSPLSCMITALPPLDHQLAAFQRFHVQDYGAFFCEMGTGKTKMILDIIQNGHESNVLVVAPNGLHLNWFHIEIPKHIHSDIKYSMYCWEGRPTSEKAHKKLFRFLEPHNRFGHDINFMLINVEALRTKAGYDAAEAFLKSSEYAHMVIDESTCIKNPKAQQTKACLKLSALATRRWILNGTPVTQGPLDVFSQCKFLHPEALPYRTYTAFKNNFAEETLMTMQNRSFRKITGYKNLSMLTAQLSPFSLRLQKEDCLDLPPKIFTERIVEMTPAQKQAYKDMRDLCLMQLDTGQLVTASIALTKLVKLHQILTGFVTDEHGDCHDLDNNRIPALLSIAEIQKPLVIFCAYRHNVHQVTSALAQEHGEDKVVSYYGESSQSDRTAAIERFQNGEADFFVGTSAAAKGITLHRASTLIYYSNSYSLETRLQSQDRIHRIGQTSKCTYIDLVTPGTVDQMILKALLAKKDLADTVLKDIRDLLTQ